MSIRFFITYLFIGSLLVPALGICGDGFREALTYNIESIILYPTDVTVDGYNLVDEEILVSDPSFQKRIIASISKSKKYRPNHPRTDKAFRILVKIEGQNDLDFRASLLVNGEVMLRHKKNTFISDDLGEVVLEYLKRESEL